MELMNQLQSDFICKIPIPQRVIKISEFFKEDKKILLGRIVE